MKIEQLSKKDKKGGVEKKDHRQDWKQKQSESIFRLRRRRPALAAATATCLPEPRSRKAHSFNGLSASG